MRTDVRALNEALKRAWCEGFEIEVLPDGAISVLTPFLFADGDSYPVLIEERSGRWVLTDRGLTVSHLQYEELERTAARDAQIARFASRHGAEFEGELLVRQLRKAPSVEDIADFLELIAQVVGLPDHVSAERESDQFRTRAREMIASWLPAEVSVVSNWKPTAPRGELFPADLRLPVKQGLPIVAFFAGSGPKADRSMASVVQYQKWRIEARPLLAHNGALTSDTIYRAQTILESESAVVAVNERASETGYLPLRRVLAEMGVPVR